MKYLIDTNIIIDALRKKEPALGFLEQCAEHYRPAISYVTLTEIMAGCRPQFKKQAQQFLDSFDKQALSEAVAFLAGELIFHYARKGKTLHFQDALIAATAIDQKMTLATANVKDFAFIKELTLFKYQA